MTPLDREKAKKELMHKRVETKHFSQVIHPILSSVRSPKGGLRTKISI